MMEEEVNPDRCSGRRKPQFWPAAVRGLHWLTLLVVVVGVGSIYSRDLVEERSLRLVLLETHRRAGMLVWIFCWFRLAVRLRFASQAPTHDASRIGRWAATAVHGALYACLLAVPPLGAALSDSRGLHLDWFGLSVPHLVAADEDLADKLEAIHRVAALSMFGLAALHAAAALLHHFVLRDGVLRSILWRRSEDNFPL